MIIMTKAQRTRLMHLYNSTVDECRHCGCLVKTQFGDPLGRYFVLSTKGEYFCMDCDHLVPDEEIFEPDLYEEEDCDD